MRPKGFEPSAWTVLKEIKKEEIATKDGCYLRFTISPLETAFDEKISFADQRRLIYFFEKEGILNIHRTTFQSQITEALARIQNIEPDVYILDIHQPQFDQYFQKHEKLTSPLSLSKTTHRKSLIGANINFQDDVGWLTIDQTTIHLPPFLKEHQFCKAAFKHPAHVPVDWSTIFESMTGDFPEDVDDSFAITGSKRMVYDTMNLLNKRVKKETRSSDKLFAWRENTIARMYLSTTVN